MRRRGIRYLPLLLVVERQPERIAKGHQRFQPSCGDSGVRPGLFVTFIESCSGHLRRPALLPRHVVGPALTAAGEVLALGD